MEAANERLFMIILDTMNRMEYARQLSAEASNDQSTGAGEQETLG